MAVELLPKDQWSAPSEIVLQDEHEDPNDQIEEETNLLPKNVGSDAELIPTGKVVGIIRRKWRQYCGILQPNKEKNRTRHLFVPAERKIPKVKVETRQSEQLQMQRIIVAIDSWPRHSR